MFAVAFQILRTIDWDVAEVTTFATGLTTFKFAPSCSMILEQVITETLCGWSNNLTLQTFGIVPGCEKSFRIHLLLYLDCTHGQIVIIEQRSIIR